MTPGMANRFATMTQYHKVILAHGILGALVFLLIVPSAVMIVRFHTGRPGFAVRYHARLQIIATLLLTVVFILGNLAVGPKRSLTNPHHGIGVAIYVLYLLQFIGGRIIYRIQKAHSLRVTLHQWGGRATALLGITQVPLGLTLYGSPRYLFILYAVWMAFLVVLYFILNFRSGSRREFLMDGPISEAGRTRVTDSEYFSERKDEHGKKWKWLGGLAAAGGLWYWLRGRGKDRDASSYRSASPSYRSHGPSRRDSTSYYDSEKFTDMTPQRDSGGGGGKMMKALGGAAALFGAGKLVNNFMDRRNRGRDDDYSAVSTETPRRQRPGRIPPSELSSEYTEDLRGDPTSVLSPSENPTAMAGAMSAAGSRPMTSRPPQVRRPRNRRSFDESEYSSYVSPSRRNPEDDDRGGGGLAKGILGGIGLGWLGKRFMDRRARKEEERRLQEEDDMRSGLTDSRFTGDGYPSPTRKPARRPTARRHTGLPPHGAPTEMTESSFMDDQPPSRYSGPPPPGPVPVGAHSRSRSRRRIDPVSMPAMPPDPHLQSDAESSFISDARPQRRGSSRRRRAGERATAAAAARASELAADEERERERYGSPHSQPLSVKLKMHDDRDRNVTLRRLTDEEARAARGPRSRSRADSEGSMSGMDSPSYGRSRYRRDTSQHRAELAAEHRAETETDTLGPLSPPNPAFSKGRRGGNKDSAYYSGGAAAGPSGSAGAAGHTASSLGSLASPESHGTWSQMSPSPGADAGDKGPGSAADNRRRRRQERRRGSSSRPTTATDMFD